MKFLITLSLIFILPLQAQDKNPFDNWLFEFFEGDSETFGDILDPDGEELDQGAGKMVTSIDLKNKIAKSITTVRFKIRKDKVKSVSTVKHKEKNVFTGVTKDSAGAVSDYTLTILDEKSYRSIVNGPNGIVLTVNGKLINENTIETTEVMRDADGNKLLTFNITFKKGKKLKNKER